MVTKKISKDAAEAKQLAGNLDEQADAVETAFEALAKELGVQLQSKPGAFAADLVALLNASATRASGSDAAHGAQGLLHTAPIDGRDAAAGVLHGKIERYRSGLSAQYGDAVVTPVFGRVPVHAAQLSAYTAQLLQTLGKAMPTWKPLDEPGGSADAQGLPKITAALATLDEAIAAVTTGKAAATTTFADRERAGALLHRLLIASHSLGIGLLTAASLDTEADHLITHHAHPAATTPAPVPAKT